ncbi:MAG: cobalamin-dependent protein, partial [Anaerolineales bacterium]|nr:cobalamin-dependent protein [Anaerolineales bacterium]
RLYSERDIATINWLQARKEEGLSISRAVSMWKRLVSEGEDPLEAESYETEEIFDLSSRSMAVDAVSELRGEWIRACLAFNEMQSERVLVQALAVLPSEIVVLEILQKAIIEIGEGWYGGRVTVQQEHFASALIIRRLNALLMAAPAPNRSGRVLVACPPGEEHSIGPLLFTWMLRRRGWDVVFLGADVPLDRFRATLEIVKPKIAALSAQQLSTAGALREMVGMLVEAEIPVVYGGRIFERAPTLARWIPGRYLDGGVVDAANLTEQILVGHRPAGGGTPALVPEFDAAGLTAHFITQKNQVVDGVLLQTRELFEQYPPLITIHEMMVRSVIAVLKIGRIEFLENDVDWARGFLENFDIPGECLGTYLDAFYQAILSNLDQRGRPLFAWFEGRT